MNYPGDNHVPSDLERFKSLYESLGIDLIVNETEDLLTVKLGDEYGDEELTRSSKFSGYSGFFSDIQFTKDGEFISQGFWE